MNHELTSLLALLASSKRGDRGEVEWGGGGEDTDFAAAALASNSRNKLRDFFEMPVSIWERKISILKTCQLEHKFTGLNQNKLNKMSEKAQWSWNERTSEFQSFFLKKKILLTRIEITKQWPSFEYLFSLPCFGLFIVFSMNQYSIFLIIKIVSKNNW